MVAMALLAVTTLLFHFLSQPASQSSIRMRWVISPPEGTILGHRRRSSPSGDLARWPRIAFVAGSAGKSQMYIQSLDALKASALTGTEGASWPFWSPDSRSLGFFAHGQLKRIAPEGGSPIDICEARVPRGAS